MTAADHEARVELILAMAQALHEHGSPAGVLEDTLSVIASSLGVPGRFFSTPTSVFVAFGDGARQRVHLLRIERGTLDLGRLTAIDTLAGQLIDGQQSVASCRARLEGILAAPPRWGRAVRVLAHTCAAIAAARLFGPGVGEMLTAGVIGLLLGLAWVAFEQHAGVRALFEFGAAASATVVAGLVAWLGGEIQVLTTVLAAVIFWLPGLTLTQAMTELATGHLASGTARLMGAGTRFVQMAFGIAVGVALVDAFPSSLPAARPLRPLTLITPSWLSYVAIVLIAPNFMVLLGARARQVAIILPAVAIAWLSASVGSRTGEPQLGAFAGAAAVGVVSNAWARWTDSPAILPMVSGILVLVPGSVGLRSMSALAQHKTLAGVDELFGTVLIAAAIVSGLLAANLLVQPRSRL